MNTKKFIQLFLLAALLLAEQKQLDKLFGIHFFSSII